MFLLDKMILSSEKKKNDIKEWRYRIDIFENIRETAHTLHYLYDLELNDITMDLLRQ
jgi:hypothetical protein